MLCYAMANYVMLGYVMYINNQHTNIIDSYSYEQPNRSIIKTNWWNALQANGFRCLFRWFCFSDFSVLLCASPFLLRTIFASLAHTCTHKVRDFPQAEFDGETNARFFSNEHGDLYFITKSWCENYPL